MFSGVFHSGRQLRNTISSIFSLQVPVGVSYCSVLFYHCVNDNLVTSQPDTISTPDFHTKNGLFAATPSTHSSAVGQRLVTHLLVIIYFGS